MPDVAISFTGCENSLNFVVYSAIWEEIPTSHGFLGMTVFSYMVLF